MVQGYGPEQCLFYSNQASPTPDAYSMIRVSGFGFRVSGWGRAAKGAQVFGVGDQG